VIKTPQEIRRESIKDLFDRILQTKILTLSPSEVTIEESFNSDFTSVNLVFSSRTAGLTASIRTGEEAAKGFVDGIFRACHKALIGEYPSLANLKLADYRVAPNFNKIRNPSATDATAEVTIAMQVSSHGRAEFSSASRSILHSSLTATLEAFQFYINCEKTFHKIQTMLTDAESRNRGDIVQACVSDMSRLTEVNTYDKENKN
jgi:hypothetical protein